MLFTFSIKASITITSNNTGGGNWNSTLSWNGGVVPNSTNNVIILNGDAITLTADASCIDLTINGGATGGSLAIGSYMFTISGNLTVTSPGTISTTCNSQLVINDYGGKNQILIPSSITLLQKITMNRAAGASCNHDLSLSSCVPADSIVIVLTNGVLEMTSGARLGLNSIAIKQDIVSSDNSYVGGIVSRTIPSIGKMYVFPIGDGGISRRFGVAEHSGTDGIHEVQFFKTIPINYAYVNFNFLPGGITKTFYWRHVEASGGNPQRRIYYNDSDFPNLTAAQRIAYLTLANNKVSSPTEEWTKATTGWSVYDDPSQKYCQFDGANNSNNEYWTFGSTSYDAPLPISLLYFSATKVNEKIQMLWATASETNNNYFTVERSKDGQDFNEVVNVDGVGNSNSIINYSAIDKEPYNGISYYRLKQTDFDGKFSYSNMVPVNFKQDSKVLFSPNPTNEIINITLPDGAGSGFIDAYNEIGLKVYSETFNKDNINNNILSLNVKKTLGQGIYFFNVTANNSIARVYSEKIIVY